MTSQRKKALIVASYKGRVGRFDGFVELNIGQRPNGHPTGIGHYRRTLLAPSGMEAEAGAGAMLAACRLAGLTAVAAYYAGVNARTQSAKSR
jgi:hypothetical protein